MNSIDLKDHEEQKKELFRSQKQLLDTFLEHGAISRTQYDKSLGNLIVKIAIPCVLRSAILSCLSLYLIIPFFPAQGKPQKESHCNPVL